jgi:predicted nucleic acid-binding protein
MAGVIADASPLIALQQIGQISLIERLFKHILIPTAVVREVSPSLPALPAWIVIHDLTQPIGSEILRASLGAGESETLALGLEVGADLVIIDERPARKLAIVLGLPVVGTAGILLAAKRANLIPDVRPLLDALIEKGFRVSTALRDRILADAGEAS